MPRRAIKRRYSITMRRATCSKDIHNIEEGHAVKDNQIEEAGQQVEGTRSV